MLLFNKLKQSIAAIAAKVRRYQGWVDSHRQNRLFENNQRRFYRKLYQEEERCDDDQPLAGESKQFWGNIWSQYADLESGVNFKRQEKIDITAGSLKNILSSMPNWKSPRPDFVQGFWLKNFIGLHEKVSLQLKECLIIGFVPSLLTRERTLLLQKDRSKGSVANNYRPIT